MMPKLANGPLEAKPEVHLPSSTLVSEPPMVRFALPWVCLKIVYPYTQWLMIIIPTKWL